ncbi:protein of unknown function [Rhodovastum atsumiense]|nr:protein of unknown function [Rhodovastum atsumiense]
MSGQACEVWKLERTQGSLENAGEDAPIWLGLEAIHAPGSVLRGGPGVGGRPWEDLTPWVAPHPRCGCVSPCLSSPPCCRWCCWWG